MIRWQAPVIRVVEELSDPERENDIREEDMDALGVSRGVPAVGDTVTDDTGATAGADDIDALPVSVGMSVGLGEVAGVDMDMAVGRGVPAVVDTVIDDTGATAGAPVTTGLGVTAEYVTFLTKLPSPR